MTTFPDPAEAAASAGFGRGPRRVTVTYQVAADPSHDDEYWERRRAADRARGIPVRDDFPDTESYVHAFYWWRALRRENSLTMAEIEAKAEAFAWALDPVRRDDIIARRRAARGEV